MSECASQNAMTSRSRVSSLIPPMNRIFLSPSRRNAFTPTDEELPVRLLGAGELPHDRREHLRLDGCLHHAHRRNGLGRSVQAKSLSWPHRRSRVRVRDGKGLLRRLSGLWCGLRRFWRSRFNDKNFNRRLRVRLFPLRLPVRLRGLLRSVPLTLLQQQPLQVVRGVLLRLPLFAEGGPLLGRLDDGGVFLSLCHVHPP